MSKVEDKTVDTIKTVLDTTNMKLTKTKKIKKNYSKMTNLRIIQKQLVYVIGLSKEYAFKDVNKNSNYRTCTAPNTLANTATSSN
jgi:hypothetical protein